MLKPRWRSGIRIAGIVLVCAAGLWQLSLEVRIYAGRVHYPWDIEWLESSWLYQAYRVMHGLSTYGPFREGYIPSNHPPGYPFVLGELGRVFGLDFGMARTVSMLFFLSAVALVARSIVRHEEGRLEGWALAAFALGTCVAGVPVFHGFYDLVREDTMAVFLGVLAASLVDVPHELSARRIAALALVITAIVFTRLPAVFFAMWVVLHAIRRDRKTGLLLALSATAACGLALAAIQFTSKGYYWLLTIALVQEHRFIVPRVTEGLALVIRFAPFAAAIPVVALGLDVARRLSPRTGLWVGMLVASVPASLLPYAKVGGYANDLMPMVFLIGPATAFVVGDLLRAVRERPGAELVLLTLFFGSGAAFLLARTYGVLAFVPTDEDFRRARALNATVASLEGGVLCPRHPFIPIRDGHDTLEWSDQPYYDMQWSGFTDLDLGGYVDRGDADWALIAGDQALLTDRELARRFQLDRPLRDAPATFVGLRSQLKYLLRRQDGEEGARVLFDFETDLEGWSQEGDAFRITSLRPEGQGPIYGAVGMHVVSSFHPTEGDAAKGTLTSPAFVIDRPRLALRLSGWKPGTRAELQVEGRTERTASGVFERADVLIKEVWDTGALVGKEARLVLVDEDSEPWGRLLVDHVVLY